MVIKASTVKELRERTGAGMMDCKKALDETDSDMEAAINLMRISGVTKAAKKSGRITTEGLVKINVSANGKTAIILEVNSETDFVTKGDIFINFVDVLGELALKTTPANIDEFLTQTMENGVSLETVLIIPPESLPPNILNWIQPTARPDFLNCTDPISL